MIPGTFSPMWASSQVPVVEAYIPNAVHFDATTTGDYFYIDPANVANSKEGTLSFWMNPIAAYNGTRSVVLGVAGGYGSGVECYLDYNNNRIFIDFGSGGTAVELASSGAKVNAISSGWKHFLASWNTNTGTGHIYINDTEAKDYNTTQNVTITYHEKWGFGCSSFGNRGQANADFADLWFDPSYIDISVEANRRKFIDGDGAPVSLGANGETPTGSAPAFYLGGNASNYINFGTGGTIVAQESTSLTDVTPPS